MFCYLSNTLKLFEKDWDVRSQKKTMKFTKTFLNFSNINLHFRWFKIKPTITIHKTGNKKVHFHNIFTLASSANKPHIQVLKQARNDHLDGHGLLSFMTLELNETLKKKVSILLSSPKCMSPHWAICSQFESIWQSSSVVSNEYELLELHSCPDAGNYI